MEQLSNELKSIYLRAAVTDVCNFSCRYCATDLGMENHTPVELDIPVMAVDAYLENLRRITIHGFENISLTGGEPLLANNVPELLRGCRAMFKTVELTTNGTMIPRYMDDILENVDVLKISIDAMDPETRMTLAGSMAARKTTEIIELCCQSNIKTIGLNFVCMRDNQNQLKKLVQFARQLKERYGTEVYVSVLDLYYSNGNSSFWKDQFVNLEKLRADLRTRGFHLTQRFRIGCDSYSFDWDGVRVTMKDSISCTHRMEVCKTCQEYCQEGIYSLKHSASGWISVCPSNSPKLGAYLDPSMDEETAHILIGEYVRRLNGILRTNATGAEFAMRRGVEL